MRKLLIAITLQGLILSTQALAYYESSPYVDPRFGRVKSNISDLLNERPDPNKVFILKDSLFNTYSENNPEDIKSLYEQRALGVSVPKHIEPLSSTISHFANLNATSLLSYLFKAYSVSGRRFDIPLVLSTDHARISSGYDEHYSGDSVCEGMSYLEANLKNKCHIDKRLNYGLMEVNYSRNIGLYDAKTQIKQVPENGIQESYAYKVFKSFPNIIGFQSHSETDGFRSPLSSFDKNLFSYYDDDFITEKTKFSKISSKCFRTAFSDCQLYFAGINTAKLFGQIYNPLKPNHFENFDKNSNLPIHFGVNGRPFLNLKNTILSESTFVNYGFYTEAELSVFKDLGYDINVQEFYGNSVYKSGTKGKRGSYVLSSGFSAWNPDLHVYKLDQASSVPLTVGSHIYGSYNDVEQHGTIASIGYSAVGIRVDGSYNNITIPKNVAVIENGVNASGIAVTYGRDNVINVEGTVEARSKDGVAIRMDFGSNTLSDLREYQGSYRRVRTQDVKNLVFSKKTGEAVKAPADIRGPLVSTLNISGNVVGTKAAIFIDDSAHVRQINLTNRAKIQGDIISDWHAYLGADKKSIYAPHANTMFLPGRLQFDKEIVLKSRTDVRNLLQKLQTNINLGVKPRDNFDTVSVLRYVPDKKANITIAGNITGSSIVLSSFGGHTHIDGNLDIKRLYVANSVINLGTAKHDTSIVDKFDMSKGGQLDLTNGSKETFIVRDKSVISSSSVLCVDADRDGKITDKIVFGGKLVAPDAIINLEPGVSYNDVKRYSSDPKALLKFMDAFVKQANLKLAKYKVSTKFPKHIWYVQGDMGRQIRCSSRCCYIGDFVNSYAKSSEPIGLWRYILSICGCIFMIGVALYITKRQQTRRFG